MEINFQNALISSFRKLFQYFQKIWKVSTTLFPKLVSIFLKMLRGSQNRLPKLASESLPIPPHTLTLESLCSFCGERIEKKLVNEMIVIELTPTWYHQLVEISQK